MKDYTQNIFNYFMYKYFKLEILKNNENAEHLIIIHFLYSRCMTPFQTNRDGKNRTEKNISDTGLYLSQVV